MNAGQSRKRLAVGAEDLDRIDAFIELRDRVFGLRCAISGAAIASENDRRGLLQFVEDVSGQMERLCEPGSV